MAYTISKKQPKYFLFASYQMSPGVENKISTKKYIRVGQKLEFWTKFIKNHPLEILNLRNGLHCQWKLPQIYIVKNSYQMSLGVENKISTQKYFREVKNSKINIFH